MNRRDPPCDPNEEAYLKLSCPEMGRWIINEAAGEVALDAADQVVVLGVRALPARPSACWCAGVRASVGYSRYDTERVVLHD